MDICSNMEHDFITINSEDQIGQDNGGDYWTTAFRQIANMPLVVSKLFMNKTDFDDIVKWSKDGT
jgi:hypothetical protein